MKHIKTNPIKSKHIVTKHIAATKNIKINKISTTKHIKHKIC